jgi:hypothetical protein
LTPPKTKKPALRNSFESHQCGHGSGAWRVPNLSKIVCPPRLEPCATDGDFAYVFGLTEEFSISFAAGFDSLLSPRKRHYLAWQGRGTNISHCYYIKWSAGCQSHSATNVKTYFHAIVARWNLAGGCSLDRAESLHPLYAVECLTPLDTLCRS